MDSKRNANMKVESLKQEINNTILLLKMKSNPRVARQRKDAMCFLQMISKPPYNTCVSISDLLKRLSLERNKIIDAKESLEEYLPGYQFSMFEDPKEISLDEKKEIEKTRANLLREERWLHKCMGIAMNRDYFK